LGFRIDHYSLTTGGHPCGSFDADIFVVTPFATLWTLRPGVRNPSKVLGPSLNGLVVAGALIAVGGVVSSAQALALLWPFAPVVLNLYGVSMKNSPS
jgi:hypothetical protein